MAHIYDTIIYAEYQGYKCEEIEKDEKGRNILRFQSSRTSKEEICCRSSVAENEIRKVRLNNVPLLPGIPTIYEIHQHRYRCRNCGSTQTEANPFKVNGF